MTVIVNILLIILFLVIIPFIIGLLFEDVFAGSGGSLRISRCFVMGTAVELTLFQVIAVPMIYYGTSFNSLLYIFSIAMVIVTAWSLFKNGRTFVARISERLSQIEDVFKSVDKMYRVIGIIAIVMIVFQTLLLVLLMHTDTDDSRFLAEALEAVEKNTLLRVHPLTGESLDFPIGEMNKDVSSAYPIFIAAIAVFTRMHPTVLAHIILPMILIPLAYSVFSLIGEYFFKETEKQFVYMFILSVTMLFSFESIYALGYTLLTIIWQGRSIAAVIMLPFLWYVLMKVYTEECMSIKLFFALVTIGIANACLSGMGTLIAPIMGGVFALSYFVSNKKIIPAFLIALSVVPCGLYAVLYRSW